MMKNRGIEQLKQLEVIDEQKKLAKKITTLFEGSGYFSFRPKIFMIYFV